MLAVRAACPALQGPSAAFQQDAEQVLPLIWNEGHWALLQYYDFP